MRVTDMAGAAALAIALASAPVATGAAQNITGCVGPAGQIRIIDAGGACRPNETLTTWNAQGPAGPQGPQGPAGPAGSAGAGSLHVVDANGTDVGPFTPMNNAVLLPRPDADGLWLEVPSSSAGFSQASSATFYFSTPCPAGGGAHDPSDRYLFSQAGASGGQPLTTFALAAQGTFYYPGPDVASFTPVSQETVTFATGVTTCSNTVFPGGRYGKVVTAPVPAVVAPFKVVLK